MTLHEQLQQALQEKKEWGELMTEYIHVKDKPNAVEASKEYAKASDTVNNLIATIKSMRR